MNPIQFLSDFFSYNMGLKWYPFPMTKYQGAIIKLAEMMI